jgi:hypothetical protein
MSVGLPVLAQLVNLLGGLGEGRVSRESVRQRGLEGHKQGDSDEAGQPEPEKRTGRSESVVRVFHKSAQAAQARRQRARNAPLLPGRSESVVRGS